MLLMIARAESTVEIKKTMSRNNETLNQTVGTLRAGASQREVAGCFNVHPWIISRLLRRYSHTGSINDHQDPVDRLTTPRQQAYVQQRHSRDRCTAANDWTSL